MYYTLKYEYFIQKKTFLRLEIQLKYGFLIFFLFACYSGFLFPSFHGNSESVVM